MIEIEKLNSTERKKIKLEIRQVVVTYLAIGIILTIVTSAAIIFIKKSDSLPVDKGITATVLLSVVVFGFAAFLYNGIKDYLRDLRSDSKRVFSGQIIDKPMNTNWGWHGSPAADSSSQPKLVEYFFVIDNQKIQVEEEVYNRYEIGERVSMSFTTKSSNLLGLTKELHSGNKAQA